MTCVDFPFGEDPRNLSSALGRVICECLVWVLRSVCVFCVLVRVLF